MTTPRQEAIIQVLKVDPTLSNRTVAKQVGCHHVSVGAVRAKMEKAGELQRTDTVMGGDGKSYKRTKLLLPKKRCQPHKVKAKSPVADVPQDTPTVTVNQPAASVLKPLHDVRRDITPDADNDDYGDGDLPSEERIALHEDRAIMHRHAPRQDAVEAREPEPLRIEEWWELGKVVHLHQATQCGRVRLSEGGEELHFTDRTPLEPGLVLRVGQEVDCRVVERPGRYPTIAELASPLPA
jgi:hypothetical protein